MKKFSSIRYTFIQSHFYALFLNIIIVLSTLLMIYVIYEPNWLTVKAIFLFVTSFILVSLCVSIYAGIRYSSAIKERLDGISILIKQLAHGNYDSRIELLTNNELGRIGGELNELGQKLQSQVKSLQRMADEKSEYAKSAHKAAVIEERQRLARDLHDAVSQQLFALTMMAQATQRLFDQHPAAAKEHLAEMTTMALQAQTEMRALLMHLRPVQLSGEPLSVGVQHLVDELQQKCSIRFRVHIDYEKGLPEGTEDHLFRIIQEALSNVLRHAEAEEVSIVLQKKAHEVFLHIGDNGKGFTVDHQKKASYGLKTMKERTEELGGNFAIHSKQGKGTHLDIRIPT
ncbi:sensor histidine kinase [Pontibacillus litoralis]|uniref:Sensor histidine kinase n=1 Tax=Pontibacillus litoralis JSM 072002 TaxID=1385512 RepID=A0A0A5FY65_9BACI|nr:histidine kinase [Pontibacillus litoralis JSM 072002]